MAIFKAGAPPFFKAHHVGALQYPCQISVGVKAEKHTGHSFLQQNCDSTNSDKETKEGTLS